jgi:ADP-ribose pyrophosphatase YjhB (NUDIX family)
MEIVPGAGSIIEKEGKILLVQEKKPQCYKQWNFVAGKVDAGESIVNAAVREAKEETGLGIKLKYLVGVYHSKGDKPSHPVRFIFAADVLSGEPAVPENEILDAKWFSHGGFDAMPDKELRCANFMRKSMEDYRKGKSFLL